MCRESGNKLRTPKPNGRHSKKLTPNRGAAAFGQRRYKTANSLSSKHGTCVVVLKSTNLRRAACKAKRKLGAPELKGGRRNARCPKRPRELTLLRETLSNVEHIYSNAKHFLCNLAKGCNIGKRIFIFTLAIHSGFVYT